MAAGLLFFPDLLSFFLYYSTSFSILVINLKKKSFFLRSRGAKRKSENSIFSLISHSGRQKDQIKFERIKTEAIVENSIENEIQIRLDRELRVILRCAPLNRHARKINARNTETNQKNEKKKKKKKRNNDGEQYLLLPILQPPGLLGSFLSFSKNKKCVLFCFIFFGRDPLPLVAHLRISLSRPPTIFRPLLLLLHF